MLVTLAIIALLVSLLLPGLSAIRARSRAFACQTNQRSVAFDFAMFADTTLHGRRGDDLRDPDLRSGQFWLETFQESQYEVDEFWERPEPVVRTDASALGVMHCPEVRGRVTLRRDTTCSSGAVKPAEQISFAFNYRLYQPERQLSESLWGTRKTPLSDRILSEFGRIPLLWGTDGGAASAAGRLPYYNAPPVHPGAPYTVTDHWFPADRHRGRVHVAFVGGEVAATAGPLEESGWRWDYAL